jgi:hypothetical protein
MELTTEFAFEFWKAIYGEAVLVSDCFGDQIYKEDYGNTTLKRHLPGGESFYYGWTIDHILPIAKGGDNSLNNFEIMHWQNNSKKADKTSFIINNVEYEVYRCKVTIDGYNGYGIQEKNSKTRVDWKAKYNKHF